MGRGSENWWTERGVHAASAWQWERVDYFMRSVPLDVEAG